MCERPAGYGRGKLVESQGRAQDRRPIIRLGTISESEGIGVGRSKGNSKRNAFLALGEVDNFRPVSGLGRGKSSGVVNFEDPRIGCGRTSPLLWDDYRQSSQGEAEKMAKTFKKLTEIGAPLTVAERNFLSVSYKNSLERRRISWRVLASITKKVKDDPIKKTMAEEYRKKAELRLKEMCEELLRLIDGFLLPNAHMVDAKIFYLQLRGDCLRYLSLVVTKDQMNRVKYDSNKAYREALKVAINAVTIDNIIAL